MKRAEQGFTLIEVMVALAIMTVVSIMAWQGISGMLQAQKFSRERSAPGIASSSFAAGNGVRSTFR